MSILINSVREKHRHLEPKAIVPMDLSCQLNFTEKPELSALPLTHFLHLVLITSK